MDAAYFSLKNNGEATSIVLNRARAGMYYATGFVPGVGGHLTLKVVPPRAYWMQAPPLGEIDFVRKPDGSMQVDIFVGNTIR